MKKKIYFIISSILQITASIYLIINSSSIIQTQLDSIKEVYAVFPASFQDRIISMLSNNGVTFITSMSIIGIVLNILIFRIAIKNEILKKKGKLIALSIICFFTSNSSLVSILSIINFIILVACKRTNPEDFPEPKKDIPHLEYQKSTKKELITGILLIVIYFSQFLVKYIIPEDNTLALNIFVIAFYVLLFVLSLVFFKDKLKRDLKLFKENYKSYFGYVLPKLGIMYIIFITSSLIGVLITKQATSVNQQTLESMPKWFILPAAIIWAPIVEELIFRGTFRRFIKNEWVFIITSAIVFGLLHTISEETLLNTIILAIPYGILGGTFAYIYAKTDNLSNNILAHAFNNAVAMLLTSLISFIIF